MRCFDAGAAILFVSAGTTAAEATEEIAHQARDLTKRATAAFNLGSYDEAAKQYEDAYRLVQDAILLFNIGQSYRLAGRPEKALTAYKAYLRTGPTDAPNREQVARRVAELEKIAAETRTAQAAPAPGTLSGGRGDLGPPVALSLAPLSRAPPSLDASTTREPPSLVRTWWFWTGVGATVAAGLIAAVVLSARGGTDVPRTPLGNQPIFR